ncbi:MAG: hypothetical protein KKB31_04770 [Nanoarchaeota archaeon]|nr:hypothetical protein [Nanoarchaeota archaeon]
MVQSILTKKRAQAWGLDVTVAIVIFFAGIVVLYIYAINYSSGQGDDLDDLFYEGNLASELILSDSSLGILSDGKVNQTKLEAFDANYINRRTDFGISRNFYFTLDNGVNYGRVNTTGVDNFIQVTRITIYNNKPTKFQLFVYS